MKKKIILLVFLVQLLVLNFKLSTIFASQPTNSWWTAANNIPQPTINVSAGGSLTYYSDGTNRFLYAFFGGGTRNFQRLNLTNVYSQTWQARCQAPDTVTGAGAHLASRGGSGKINAVRGAGTNSYEFWEYDFATDKWQNPPYVPSNNAGAGRCIVNVSSTDYYAVKGSDTTFMRYRISADGCTTNQWDNMAALPWNAAAGATLAYNNGDFIFITQGGSRAIARYTISTNTMVNLTAIPAGAIGGNLGAGAGMAYVPSGVGQCTSPGGCLFLLRGATTANFARGDIATDGTITWTARAAAPWTVGAGGALVYAGGNFLYAFRGNGSAQFARYNLTNNTWSDPDVADPPEAVANGGSLTYVGGAYSDYIYARRSQATTTFWRYSISSNAWSSLTNILYSNPTATNVGNILAGNSTTGHIYTFAGSGASYPDFWKYDIVNNHWGVYALDAVTGAGCSLTKYSDDDLYLIHGNNSTSFGRYRSSTNSWTGLTALPETASAGASSVYARDGAQDYIYALRGDTTTNGLWRWQIPSGTAWTAMASAPGAFGTGASSVWTGGDYIYAFQGGGTSTAFWRYCISTNNWNCGSWIPSAAPAAVGAGGSLVWTGDDYIYAFRGGGNTAFWRYRWRDSIKPTQVTNLSAQRSCTNPLQVDLSWTTPGDDYDEDISGTSICTSYEIRYNTVPITDLNWASSTVAGAPACSGNVGSAQSFTASVPSENTTYYFAIKARDEGHPWDANLFNWSDLSNVVSIKTPTSGQGTASISPNEVAAGTGGNTITITYTAGTDGMICGRVYVDVPVGWSAPSVTSTAEGYTTASTGIVSVFGQQIRVSGINLPSGGTLTIVYGSKAGGGPGANAQTTAGVATFTVSSHSGPGTPTAIGTSPTVNVVAGTGQGTATITPLAVIASSSGNNMQIVYTPGSHNMNKGRVYVNVPSGWTAPLPPSHPSCPAGAGCVSVVGGGSPIVNCVGQQIQVSNIILSSPSTLTINYNNATAQAGITCGQPFMILSAAGAVTPSLIENPPQVNVSATGQGTNVATPSAIVVSSTGNTLNFTYTAGANQLCQGRVYIEVPPAFPNAPSTIPTDEGYSTSSTGTVSISGRTIQVTGINLSAGDSMTITYGSKSGGGQGFTAPSTTDYYTFTTFSATGPVAPSAIATSPVVRVAQPGEGEATMSPNKVGAGTGGNTMTIYYKSGPSGLSNGRVYVDVPPGWTQPTTSNTSTSQGILTCVGMQIRIVNVNCSANQPNCVVITYGTGAGVTAQNNPVQNIKFTTYAAAMDVDPTSLPPEKQPTVDVLATGEGTASISPAGVVVSSTGNTLTITYTAGSTAMSEGRIYIDIPSGWSAPSTTETSPGYTTSTVGTVSVVGQQIRVSGINLSAGGSLKIVYGSKAGGGPGATAENNIICSRQFLLQSAVGPVTPMPIAIHPTVNVAAQRQGTAIVESPSPAEVGQNSPGNTITIRYTAGENELCNGRVYINVPSGWSAPSTTETSPGYTTSSAGTVSVVGQQIRVSGINLSAGDSLKIVYGETAGGGPGATAGSTLGANTFIVSSATGPVAPANIETPPSVNVLATGKGTATISPTCVSAGSSGNNITITYTPNASYPLTNGRVYVTVPTGWTTPTLPNVSCSTGTASVSGMEIRCNDVTLSSPSTLTINYNNVTAQSNANTSVAFIVKDAVGAVTPMPITISPTVNVATSGTGTNTVSPDSIIVSSTGNTLTFTYTASSVGMSGGRVYISVPCAATPSPTQFAPCPQTTTPSGGGYLTCTSGSCSWNGVAGRIEVSGLNLSGNQSVNIVYGDMTSGGSGVSAPTSTGNFAFTTSSSTGTCGILTDISVSPVVFILPEGGIGTNAAATGYSSQRKIARNSRGFWMFYDNGSNFVSRFSSTGLSWAGSEQTVFTTTTRVGSIWVDTTNNFIYAIGWPTSATTQAAVRRGSISAASNPSWETQTSPVMSGVNNDPDALCSICRASDGHIWIACEQITSGTNRNVSVSRSTSANSVANFSGYVSASTDSAIRNFAPIVLPGSDTGQAYLVYNRAGAIEGRLVNIDLSFGPVESIATGISGDWARSISGISDTSYNIHVVYIASDGSLRYRYRQAGTWQTEVVLDSATTCYSPSIQLRGTDLYVSYNIGNNIYVRKGVPPYTAANWTLVASPLKADTITTTHYTVTNAIDTSGIILTHTAGTASPYSVKMEIIGQGSASIITPSPAELGAGTSGNTIVFSYTAGQSGMIGGRLYINFPPGWSVSAPTTSGGGTPVISQVGLQTQITNISLLPSQSMTITYSNVTTQGIVGNNVQIQFLSSAKSSATPLEIHTHPTINIKPIANVSLFDTAISIGNSQGDDVLRINIQNPSTTVAAKINKFRFQFKNSQHSNLTTSQAQSLFSAIQVYLDANSNNEYDEGDAQVGSASINLVNGVQEISCDGSLSCEISASSSKTYFLVVSLNSNAAVQNPNAFYVFCKPDISPTNFEITDLSLNPAILVSTQPAGISSSISKAAYWRQKIADKIYSSPIVRNILGENRIFIGSESNAGVGALHCRKLTDGTNCGGSWPYFTGPGAGIRTIPSAFRCSSAYNCGEHNMTYIYFGAENGRLYCLNQNATLIWQQTVGDGSPIRSSAGIRYMVGWDPRKVGIFVAGQSGGGMHMFAYESDTGSLKWISDFMGSTSTNSSPWVQNAQLFIGAENGTIYKINTENGEFAGSYSSSAPVKGIPMGFGDYVYVGSDKLYRLNTSTMTVDWEYNSGSNISSSPFVMMQDQSAVFFGDNAGRVYSRKADNSGNNWQYTTLNPSPVRTTVVANFHTPQVVTFGTDDGYVYLLSRTTGALQPNWPAKLSHAGGVAHIVLLHGNNRVIVATEDGYLYSFKAP